ncbi:LLM class flavin-dependent oxidoreductase [Sphaerimonospora thailandensis]|uniref:Monooxygenase n=1 Tax=Sphaerimonospora thailandensis TaxID=795644 RepID=A0A8J3RDD8_9ACTN|nr:LLM class flavin-dependent oxidoreductase [Sphaerimonospora thailandensis]GIH70438.1 monooxygenase [Sphaerimonospora thailandensis]
MLLLKLGLFFDLRNPPRWRRPWTDHYRRNLDLISAAEGMGAASVWFTEHHFLEDGYLPQPLTFAAAVAARTSRLRIGTAILLAALRHPRHVAEEAAVVDILSGGRLELGIGAGFAQREYDAFGADIRRRYTLTDASVGEIRRLFAEGEVTPPPVQRPLPIWMGYQGPQGARRAGRLGAGLLSLDPRLLEPYEQGLAEGGHEPSSARMSGMFDIIVADDPDEARRRILPHFVYQLNSYRRMNAGETESYRDLTVEEVAGGAGPKGKIPGLTVLTPQDAVQAIRKRTAALPVEHVYLWASIAGMPDDLVERHVELLFGSVAPALRAETEATAGSTAQTGRGTSDD